MSMFRLLTMASLACGFFPDPALPWPDLGNRACWFLGALMILYTAGMFCPGPNPSELT
jgi:hypothetical protein